jgi:hypothetical protein
MCVPIMGTGAEGNLPRDAGVRVGTTGTSYAGDKPVGGPSALAGMCGDTRSGGSASVCGAGFENDPLGAVVGHDTGTNGTMEVVASNVIG